MSEQEVKFRNFSKFEYLFAALALLSLVLLLIPNDALTYKKSFIPNEFSAILIDDTVNGGHSQSSWLDEQAQLWKCDLDANTPNPFCSYQLYVVGSDGSGIDFSPFETLTIFGSYQGNAEFFRLYLRNRHPDYFRINDVATTKYSGLEIPVEGLNDGVEVNMSDFKVADWWISQNKIPPHLSRPEFEDVVFIEIQTASLALGGHHEFQITEMVWEGALIEQATLYKYIIAVWILAVFCILSFRFVRLQQSYKQNMEYQKELVAINEMLNVKNKKFEDLAKTDSLTGLYNRLGIREVLYEGVTRWKKNKVPFSFVLMDIDFFKQVNDNFGHEAGDSVLKSTADLLANNVRKTDVVARWGGEEFIIVCPNTNAVEADSLAGLLRERISGYSFDEVGDITASFGVASLTTPNINDLFKSADKALYKAKATGRNKVVCD